MFQLIQLLKYMHFDEDNYGSLWQVVLNLRNFPDNNLYENISKFWLVESREFPRKYSARKVNTMQYIFLICFKIMFD